MKNFKLSNHIRKYLYLYAPLFTGIIYVAFHLIYYFITKSVFVFDQYIIESTFSVQCTFIGFFITIWLLLFALPKDNSNANVFKKTPHIRIFSYINLFGIIFSTLNVLLYLFNCPQIILICFLIFSLSELVIAGYYVFHMVRLFFMD